MKLYYAPGACSLAPHIVLREAGGEFTLVKVDTARHVTADGTDYDTLNTKGQVPMLELDDGTRLTEGPVIAQFIADRLGASALMPAAGTMERYRVQEWQNYITSELHKSFTPLFNAALDAGARRTLSEVLRKKLQWVDRGLAGTDFLTGGVFTAADAYLYTVCGWARHVGLDLSPLTHLQAFLQRVAQRPAVRAAMKAEGLALPA
ncbi:glutathione transferase GstA [Schlegelella sp. S2-27]|uniref:Glutathione transferase GstA n=1 Tax=Caldimonas mangrovi TaxID=2944811 RepID=A0ABT0YJL3_9BURK|nr:glutathione transferase GstA [Caldimonas mangrovi]MCM5678921.1 glutathione transferase GstA [Caldimonas mangrovi]